MRNAAFAIIVFFYLTLPQICGAGPLRDLFKPFIEGTTYGNKPLGYYPPSSIGYNLDTTSTGYYGGGSYTQFYNFGRGYGLSGFPEPMPGRVYYRDRPRDWSLDEYSKKNTRVPKEKSWSNNETGAPIDPAQAWVQVHLPEKAVLLVDGKKSELTGRVRNLHTPQLKPGRVYGWKLTVKLDEENNAFEEEKEVRFLYGEKVSVHFGKKQIPDKLP